MKHEIFTKKLADLQKEVAEEIITIVSKNGDLIHFTKDFFKFNYKNTNDPDFMDTITSIEVIMMNNDFKARIKRENSSIQFETGMVEDELDIYQLIDFLKYMQKYEVCEEEKEMARIEIIQHIWNDKYFKDLCIGEHMLKDIAANVIENVRENMERYLLDKHYLDIAWLEVCDGKYIINIDEVYSYFKILVEEYESK